MFIEKNDHRCIKYIVPMHQMAERMGEHWKDRIDIFKNEFNGLSSGMIVFLGDSITELFPADKFFGANKIINRGIGGDRIVGVLARLDISVYDLKPEKVFLMIGINDILFPEYTIDELADIYDEILINLKTKSSGVKIFIQSVLPVRGKFSQCNNTVLKLNEKIQMLAKKYDYPYLDIYNLMVDNDGELKNEYTYDDCHLTEQAYHIWVDFLKQMI